MGASLILMAGSTAIAAGGAYESGQANAASAQYQANVARNNQQIANMNASAATQRGEVLAEQKQVQTSQQEGMARAVAGASGIDANTGTPVKLQSDIAKLGSYDAMTIRNSAAREAYGYKVQGLSYGAQAGLDEMQQQSAATGGDLGAMASLVGGASNISNKWGSIFPGSSGAFPG